MTHFDNPPEDEAVVTDPAPDAGNARILAIADIARLALAFLGCTLVGLGAGMYFLPLGFVAPGLMLFFVAVVGGLRAGA